MIGMFKSYPIPFEKVNKFFEKFREVEFYVHSDKPTIIKWLSPANFCWRQPAVGYFQNPLIPFVKLLFKITNISSRVLVPIIFLLSRKHSSQCLL